jgi:hypothetical protein
VSANPLDGWTVPRDEIELVGRDLQRPECVLAEPDGTLWSADARGGVMRIAPDGSQTLIAQEVVRHDGDADSVARYVLEGTLPNGLAFDRAGNFVIVNVGTDVDAAFIAGTMTPEVLGGGRGTLAPMMASVTFGGPDLRTVYLGSLMGHTLPSFRSPVPGLPMAHWHPHA